MVGKRLQQEALPFTLIAVLLFGALTDKSYALGDRNAADSPFSLREEPDRPRNYFLSPLVSFILPGFDQWWEQQYGAAGSYTGLAAGSLVYASAQSAQLRDSDGNISSEASDLDNKGVTERKYVWGSQLYSFSGGLSAYHSFRTAVRSRKDQFQFLKKEESPTDLLMAPFHFSYLKRWTTLVPLAAAFGLGAWQVQYQLHNDDDEKYTYERSKVTGADGFFAPAFSYNAGVWEEATFRGWLLPTTMEWTGSEGWSNNITAGVFALAHLSSTPFPLIQFILGWDLGYITQQNGWTIGESVFIHAWYDTIVFAYMYQIDKHKKPEAQALYGPAGRPMLMLPPLQIAF